MIVKIPNYENYQIDTKGNVFSKRSHRFLKPNLVGAGYLRVGLCKNNEVKNFYIHRLVGLMFCENKNKYKEINHIDGNKTNNFYKNLEWCSRSHNQKHSFMIGLNKVDNHGSKNPMFGKKHSIKTKELISKKAKERYAQRIQRAKSK